ncbi:hypothetical protein CHLNCDRAFT_136593 [Chlorella variabilis]|uniref:Uncharacterized protein n=1 Tax=Chlorella variabilis TaxID=554065 RepID=E1ZUD7_CHLVA|nr:hypothetical protein CHLNCDRAFT_136593 [Chlorella variabilis]EFN50557.1 hypothetical protein CHLNCDRAFT_136593 [Chlorella variabilis]|eukprot:XP_005842689.1 hypothetical protein CHLNCDRAFT_136593 [Chlorella variabilis]
MERLLHLRTFPKLPCDYDLATASADGVGGLEVEPPAPGCATLTLHTATRDAGCSSPSVSLTVDQYGLGLVAGATCIDAPQPLAASVLVTAGGVPLVFYEVELGYVGPSVDLTQRVNVRHFRQVPARFLTGGALT